MISHLQQIRKERLNGERGFTLTELLVVIVIIGILVAIAIPVFLSQRDSAYARSAESDVRNAIPAIETFYSDTSAYPTATFTIVGDSTATGPAVAAPTTITINASPGVTLTYTFTAAAGTAGTYTIVANHKDLATGKKWTYSSSTSKIVQG